MRKNIRSYVEQPEFSEPQCLLDMNDYQLIEAGGLLPDLKHKKSAHMTACWKTDSHPLARIPLADSDLTGFRYLTFSVFSIGGAGGSFVLRFESDVREDGNSGYCCTLPVTQNGWNDYRVELPFLQAQGIPAGWDHIRAVVLDANDGGKVTRPGTVLYVDSFNLWETLAPYVYTKMPELKGAAVFSKTGTYSIVDRKRVSNSLDGSDEAKPFEAKGVIWVPMAPVAAILAHTPVADNKAGTLNFIYRRKKYAFSADSTNYTVDGESLPLGFRPVSRAGMLFFPADYVREFFRWRQIFTDPMGLIILSNRKNIFDSNLQEPLLWKLNAELTLPQPGGREVMEDLHRKIQNPDRGRLLLTPDEWMALRRRVKEEPTLRNRFKQIKDAYGSTSAAYRSSPVAETPAGTAEERAEQFRLASDRIVAFSAIFRLTGEKKYAERVAGEVEALTALSDWDPDRFQNAATVGLAVSFGYDWCHTAWTEARKARVERALLRNLLRPGMERYYGRAPMWKSGTAAASQINAALAAASLALADIYPETTYKVIDRALCNVAECFRAYAPDGGYAQGPDAWAKSTRALGLLIAMLESACEKTYGLDSLPGFAVTYRFAIMTETKNGAWNFGNNAAGAVDTAVFPWFTKHFGSALPAWMRQRELTNGAKQPDVLDLIFPVEHSAKKKIELPLDAVYRRAGVATFRSDWSENALFFGLHGGRNNEIGGELDAGSILLECEGERFLTETGGAETLPATVRLRAEGQNTLIVDPTKGEKPDQDPAAFAPFTEARSAQDRAYAVVDMSGTNRKILRGKRGILLTSGRTVAVVQDELILSKPGEILWSVWTDANVESVGARSVVLEKNGKRMLCKLSGVGSPARFEAEKQGDTAFTRLTVRVSGKERVRLAVACKAFREGDNKNDSIYTCRPISTWGFDEN